MSNLFDYVSILSTKHTICCFFGLLMIQRELCVVVWVGDVWNSGNDDSLSVNIILMAPCYFNKQIKKRLEVE